MRRPEPLPAVVPPLRLRPGLEGALARFGRAGHLGVILLGIFLYTGAKLTLGAVPEREALGSFDPLNTLMQLVILLGGGAAALWHGRACLALALRAWPFLLLLALMAGSALWSQSPENTLRRCISFTAMLLWVFSAQAAFGMERVMRAVVGMVLAIIAASLAEAVLRPAVGFDVGDYANAIRGIFPQKNALGMALLTGALARSFVVLERARLRPADGALLLLLLVMLVLSRSTTSLLLTLLVAGATLAILWLDRGGAWMAATWLLLGAGLGSMLLLLGGVGVKGLFDLIGKDVSLTGRTYIWEGVAVAIGKRPWLGYGYSAFWIDGSPGVRTIWEAIEWETPTAHSGYLEVLLQLGWVGAGLVLVAALATLARMARAAGRGLRRRALWMLLYMLVLGILSYSESTLLGPDLQTVFWLLGFLALAPLPERTGPASARPRMRGFVARRAQGLVAHRARPGSTALRPGLGRA